MSFQKLDPYKFPTLKQLFIIYILNANRQDKMVRLLVVPGELNPT